MSLDDINERIAARTKAKQDLAWFTRLSKKDADASTPELPAAGHAAYGGIGATRLEDELTLLAEALAAAEKKKALIRARNAPKGVLAHTNFSQPEITEVRRTAAPDDVQGRVDERAHRSHLEDTYDG